MKDFSIENVIKILYQNNPAQRDKLIAEFTTYSEARKDEVTAILLEQFNNYTEELAFLKYQELLQDVESGKRTISTELMQEARVAVDADLAKVLSGEHSDNQEIAVLQQKIQSLSVAS